MTEEQLKALCWLRERGGSGYLDRYGRVNAQGEAAPRGSWIAWLNLIASGLIVGGDRRLTVTEAGERLALSPRAPG